jgi:hypothetical protein
MNYRETPNPFVSAKVIGSQVRPADYHTQVGQRGAKDYIMSRGELVEFLHCPARWRAGYSKKDTEASEWGTLMDALLLDRNNFDDIFAVQPAMYPCEPTKRDPRTEKPWNNNATFCDEWKTEREAAGKIVISKREKDEALAAVGVLLADQDIDELIATSEKQVHIVGLYEDKATRLKIPVKALLDIVPPVESVFGKALADFKTCFSAAPFVWPRAVFEHNYHTQAALYSDLYTKATGEDRTDWLHLMQESYFPWQVGKRFLSSEFVELGRLKYTGALARYAQCLATDEWPGYEGNPNKMNFNGFEICDVEAWML